MKKLKWALVIVLLLMLGGVLAFYYGSQQELLVTVTDKERIANPENSYYLVYSKEGETFENTDTWMYLKFDSSDLQGRLLKDQQYRIRVYGIRVQLFSWYRNVIDASPAQ